MLVLNFCIWQINIGNIFYVEESWCLYQDGLVQEVLFDGGMFLRFIFNNIVAVGIWLSYLDVVWVFIVGYMFYLLDVYWELASQFNQVRLYFVEQDYDWAWQLLLIMEIIDLVNDLIVWILLLKIYYE